MASYLMEAGGPPVIESTTLTGVNQWRVEVADPLTPHPNPLVQPHLYSAIDDQAHGNGKLEKGDLVTVLDSRDAQVTRLPVGTLLPQGIDTDDYGVFRTETAVMVLPPL
ncbi:hypothetical protein [Modestobacter sp. SYSU DS0875]